MYTLLAIFCLKVVSTRQLVVLPLCTDGFKYLCWY